MLANEPGLQPALIKRSQQFQELSFDARTAEPVLNSVYLVKDRLLRDSVAVIYGPSGVGKTFLTLHLAHAIATGTDFGGHKVRQGTVIYASAEGAGSIRNRVCALPGERSEQLRILPTTVDLFDNDLDTGAFDPRGARTLRGSR